MAHELGKSRFWRKEIKDQQYVVSTLNSSLDREFLNNSFASDDMYWAKRLPLDQLETLLSHSINFGLYRIQPAAPKARTASEPSSPRTPSPTIEDEATEHWQQIGFARLSTDFVTTAYLTDVYVVPACRGGGMASWLMKCLDETLETLPALRNVLLVASGTNTSFYAKHLGMRDIKNEENVTIMHRPTWKRAAQ